MNHNQVVGIVDIQPKPTFSERLERTPHYRDQRINPGRMTARSLSIYQRKPDIALTDGVGELPSRKLRSAYLEWLEQILGNAQAIGLTFTFKQRIGKQSLTQAVAKEAIGMFRRILEVKIFGRRRRTGAAQRTLIFLPIVEGGVQSDAKHIHVHAIVGVPVGVEPGWLAQTCRRIWAGFEWASKVQNEIVVCDTPKWWLHYIFKDDDKPSYSNAIVVEEMTIGKNVWYKKQSVSRIDECTREH